MDISFSRPRNPIVGYIMLATGQFIDRATGYNRNMLWAVRQADLTTKDHQSKSIMYRVVNGHKVI